MSHIFRNFKSIFFCLILTGYGLSFAQTNPPQRVNFQGRLTDLSDNPLNGSFSLTFSLYNAPTGGAALWTETQAGVSIANGAVESLLGSVTPIPYSVSASSSVYLEIQVGAEVLSPRQPFSSVLYAMNTYQLAGKPYDAFLDTSTAQTISGIKTFSANPVFNAGAIGQASVSGLPAALATVAAATATLKAQIDGISGDNLGNHTATANLNMAGRSIISVGTITAGGFVGNGSGLTGISGDNLGNHTATTNLNMANNAIINVSTLIVAGPGTFQTTGGEITMAVITGGSSNTADVRLKSGNKVWAIGHAGDAWGHLLGIQYYNGSAWSEPGYLNILADGKVGLGVSTPAYRLDVAGDINTTGKYFGDGSGLSNISGDGLGVHIATANLNMANFSIINVNTLVATNSITAGSFYGNGSGLTGISGDNLGNHTATANLNMAGRAIVSAGTVTAVNFIGSGAGLVGVPGDNLGSHTAAASLNMANFPINNVSTLSVTNSVSAANYLGNGSALIGVAAVSVPAAGVQAGSLPSSVIASSIAVNSVADQSIVSISASKLTGALPAISGAALTGISGDNLGNHTATQQLNMAGYAITNASSMTVTGDLIIGPGNPVTFTIGAGAGDSFITAPGNQSLTIKATREEGLGNAFQVQTYNAAKNAFLDRFTVTGATDTAKISILNSNFALAHGAGVMNKVFLDGTINDGAVKRVVSLANSDGSNYGGYLALGNASSPLTDPINGATVLLSGAPNQNSYISVGNVGIGTTTPGAKLEVAGQVKITGGTPGAGKVLTSDSAGLAAWQTLSGDNLGNHTATASLNMSSFSISNVSTVTYKNNVYVAGVTGIQNGIVVSSNIYVVGFSSAVKYYGDGSGLTGITGDNLGNHTATQNLNMNSYPINSSSYVTAAFYQVNGSTMVVILPGTDSIAYGVNAGSSNVAGGNYNVFVGNDAGAANTTGFDNAAHGYSALYSNTTGNYNTANGSIALMSNTVGTANTANGNAALRDNTTGNQNTAAGSSSLAFNITGSNNTAAGSAALVSNTIGGNNTASGFAALYSNVTGSANAIFGAEAGYGAASQSFSSSTIMGFRAGYALTTGSRNTLLGLQAGDSLTTGASNIIIGYNQDATAPTISNELNIGGLIWGRLQEGTIGIGLANTLPQAALDVKSTGTATYAQIWRDSSGVVVASMTDNGILSTNSPASGDNLGDHTAMQTLDMAGFQIINVSTLNSKGFVNVTSTAGYTMNGITILRSSSTLYGTYVGENAGRMNRGNYNLFVGDKAGYNNTTGYNNTFIGHESGLNTTTESDNTFIGSGAGRSNTAWYNTFVGNSAGGLNSTGQNNAFMGWDSGGVNTTGAANTFIGSFSGGYNTTGDSNVAIGYAAGSANTTGGSNTFVGTRSGNYSIGWYNSFLGNNSGFNNTAGSYNIFIGESAGYGNTTAMMNTYVGTLAGQYNVSGGSNTIMGYESGKGGGANSFEGNTLIGYWSGNALTSGSRNVLLGSQAGDSLTAGSNNIIIGYNQDAAAPAVSNQLNIGGVLFGDLAAKTIGISTRVPQAALDIVSTGTAANQMAQIWRDSSGVIVGSVSATGIMTATKFVGDGAYLTGLIESLSLPKIRFTRTAVAYNAADGAKDSQCSSEFGSIYVTALAKDIAVMGGMVMGGTYNKFNTITNVDSSYFDSTTPAIQPVAGGTYGLACVQKYAAIRFTRVAVAFDAADATKDSQCVAELGSGYMAADARDVAANAGMLIVKAAADKAFNAAGDSVNTYLFNNSANPGFSIITGGTYSVACVHK